MFSLKIYRVKKRYKKGTELLSAIVVSYLLLQLLVIAINL